MRRIVLASIVIFAASVVASAQTDAASPQPAFGSDIPYGEALTPPLPVSGLRPPLRLSSETPQSNFVMGSLRVSGAYDDNMLLTPDHHVDDVSYLFFPALEVAQTRDRWNWDFGYSPGFSINQKLSERNQAAHGLHMLLGYRLSPHVTLQLHDNFEKTTSLFASFMGNQNEPSPGPLQQPNTSVITPLANRTGNTSGADLTYQFGRDSVVGASGGYYFVNYGAIQDTSGQVTRLIDAESWNGDGFYAHRFGGRHWTGFTYNFQRLSFDGGWRTDVQRVLWFYSVSLTQHMTFSLWAGPEQSTSTFPAVPTGPSAAIRSASEWNGAGGLAWSWQGSQTGFSLGYVQQISDGGGLAEVVKMQQGNAEVRRRLTRRWTASLGALYARNNPPGFSIGRAWRTWSGNAGFDYQITDHLGFGLRYGRDQQKYVDVAPASSANRNRAWFSISYSFSRPLGR